MVKKIVIVLQKDIKDCGCCCLQSIIKFYHGYVPLEKIRSDTFTDRGGTSAYHLIQAAQNYGFEAYGKKLTNLFGEKLIFPVIAHVSLENGLNHFVVIYQLTEQKITIMDPSIGKKILSIDEFNKIWTNIVITFHPKHNIINYPKNKNIYLTFLTFLKHEKKLYQKILWSSILITFLSILSSFYLKIGIEILDNSYDNNWLKFSISSFFFLFILKIMTNFFRNYYENFLNKNVDIYLITDFLQHIFHLPLNILLNRTTGEIVTRVNELNNIKNLFSEIFITIFLDVILALSSLIVLLTINQKLFFIALLIITGYLSVGLIFNYFLKKRVLENIDKETKFNNSLIEKINMINSIKNLNLIKESSEKLEEDYVDYLHHSFRFNHLINLEGLFKSIVGESSSFFITTVGLILLLKNQLALIDLITFTSILTYVLLPIENILNILPKFSYFQGSFEKIKEFKSLTQEDLTHGLENFHEGDIQIVNFSFSYNNYSWLFQNLNCLIKKNQHLFISGQSGIGKSSLMKCLCRQYDNYKGKILINKTDILDYNLTSLRKNITYISQNESLFSDSLFNNIICYRQYDETDFQKVCHICLIEEVLTDKPGRYNLNINDESLNLSGGEKQRIILARGLLNSGNILIIDEVLSELDYHKERQIVTNIRKYYKNKTIIYISHKKLAYLFDQTLKLEGKKL